MMNFDKLYIDGSWIPAAASTDTIDVENPYSHEVVGHVPQGSVADVDRAVAAAKNALAGWSGTPPAERAEYLHGLAAGMAERQDEIAALITAEVGTPFEVSQEVQAGLPVETLRETVAHLSTFPFETTMGNSVVQRLPVGVVAAITPWNYPLHQVIGKVGGALAAGATVVLKPSELAPLTAFVLAEIMDSIALPAGVFNLVTGPGPEIGEALVDHPDVSLVTFTGSTGVGRKIAARSGRLIKRVTLELGGKSASLVLPDADLPTAVKVSVANAFLNAGQTCSAWTRLVVPREQLAEAENLAASAAAQYTAGDPSDPSTLLGPLITERQQANVLDTIERAVSDGARIVCGGTTGNPEIGYFVEATVLSDVTPGTTADQEEFFGPVLSILAYDDVEEAIRIANGTDYGLAAGVWSSDPDAALAVANRLVAGQVDVNGGDFNPAAPFGGFKDSGFGREFGPFGIEDFLTTRSIQK